MLGQASAFEGHLSRHADALAAAPDVGAARTEEEAHFRDGKEHMSDADRGLAHMMDRCRAGAELPEEMTGVMQAMWGEAHRHRTATAAMTDLSQMRFEEGRHQLPMTELVARMRRTAEEMRPRPGHDHCGAGMH